MGLLFYPRGGSAQVARYLSRALVAHGREVTLCCGSLGPSGALGNAATIFRGIDLVAAGYDDAVARWLRGEDPMDAPFPMHPSYEPRSGVPDRAFPWVSPLQGERMAAAWARLIAGSDAMSTARLLHLHHLTPIHDAVVAALPGVPVVTHLHGTELRMLDSIARQEAPLAEGPHARWWERHLRAAAQRAVATIAISPYEQERAVRLLDLDPDTVHCLPNGVDVDRFTPYRPSDEVRRALWLRWLVYDAQGWDEKTLTPGSVRYDEREVLDAFFDPVSGEPRPVLIFVGRFLGFKRVPLLIRAYARARARMATPVPLVIWGGMPGEWEGEHPHSVATRDGVDGVYFTGWRGHDDLPLGLSCADCFVAPSTDEPFGLVYLEAMACGLPVIGTASGGPPSFVNIDPGEPDGWLVPPDDEAALTGAMVTALEDAAERAVRAANAGRHARERHSWYSTAGRLVEIYDECFSARPANAV
jgi:glycosyltransferase involved in cell wall biosynthesis